MRTILALVVTCGMLVVAPPVTAQVTLGAVGGLNFGSIAGDAPQGISYGGKTGAIVGLVGEFGITDEVSVLVQPSLSQRGTSLLVEVDGMDEPVDSGAVALSYISVPVLFRVMAGNNRTYVTAGLDAAFLSSATLERGSTEEDFKDRLNTTDLAINFGFGGIVRQGSPAITVELRYAQSLTNLSGDDPDSASQLPDRFRSNGFQLLAGVLLPIGGSR